MEHINICFTKKHRYTYWFQLGINLIFFFIILALQELRYAFETGENQF